MKRRAYLGVVALLLVVIAVILFLALPEPTEARDLAADLCDEPGVREVRAQEQVGVATVRLQADLGYEAPDRGRITRSGRTKG